MGAIQIRAASLIHSPAFFQNPPQVCLAPKSPVSHQPLEQPPPVPKPHALVSVTPVLPLPAYFRYPFPWGGGQRPRPGIPYVSDPMVPRTPWVIAGGRPRKASPKETPGPVCKSKRRVWGGETSQFPPRIILPAQCPGSRPSPSGPFVLFRIWIKG